MSTLDTNSLEDESNIFDKSSAINTQEEFSTPEPEEKEPAQASRQVDKSDDVVWQYMHAMGQIELLNREREREIESFISQSTFKVIGNFTVDGKNFRADLQKNFKTEQEAKDFLKKISHKRILNKK